MVSALEGEAREEIVGGTQVTTMKFADTITNQLVNVVEPRFDMIRNHQFEGQDKPGQTYHKRSNLPALPYHDFPNMQLRIISARNVTNVCLDRSASLAEMEERERSSDLTAAHALIAASNYGGKHVGRPNSNWGKKSHGLHDGFPGGKIGLI